MRQLIEGWYRTAIDGHTFSDIFDSPEAELFGRYSSELLKLRRIRIDGISRRQQLSLRDNIIAWISKPVLSNLFHFSLELEKRIVLIIHAGIRSFSWVMLVLLFRGVRRL